MDMAAFMGITTASHSDLVWPEVSGVQLARGKGLRGHGVRTVILDTGIDADHTEFSAKTVRYIYVPHAKDDSHLVKSLRGFDTQGHGSHVSGIICGENIGIAPSSVLAVASVCESATRLAGLLRFYEGLKWALGLCRDGMPTVLNVSAGYFPPTTHEMPETDWEDWLTLLRQLLIQLARANVLVVAAWTPTYQIPAEFQEVLAIGAIDEEFRRIDPGHYAPRTPDLLGFGNSVSSAIGRDLAGNSVYGTLTGASQAAAYVSGVAALWRQAHPTLSVRQIRKLLTMHSLKLEGNEEDDMLEEAGVARFVDVSKTV